MNWVRNISLVKRVSYGFSVMAAVLAATGGSATWLWSQQAAKLDRLASASGASAELVALNASSAGAAWALGSATLIGCMAALIIGWLIRSSIKDSV